MKGTAIVTAVAVLALCGAACDPNSLENHVKGRSLAPCVQHIPACASLYAACELNDTTYAQVDFPADSPFRFVVAARPEEQIAVTLFFVAPADAGLDTRILWYEPGCSDVYSYESEGRNLVEEAEETGTVTREQVVYDGGDHLIEIFTDLQSETVVTVEVSVPGEF
jgi:hypothetical protein